MPNVAHSALTGSNLHEPKGVASASANTVYVADGAGSGAWTDVNSVVTSTNFATGDIKATFRLTADSGWILFGGSIGDASSAATRRANADTVNLFTLLWNNVSDTYAPVSGGRGASAAADFAAHKRLTLPAFEGRVPGHYGAGSGLGATKLLGQTEGAYTHALSAAEMPTHSHSGTTDSLGDHAHTVSIVSDPGAAHSHAVSNTADTNTAPHVHEITFFVVTNATLGSGGGQTVPTLNSQVSTQSMNSESANASHNHGLNFTTGSEAAHTHAVSGTTATTGAHSHTVSTVSAGGSGAHSNTQPTMYCNFQIKL